MTSSHRFIGSTTGRSWRLGGLAIGALALLAVASPGCGSSAGSASSNAPTTNGAASQSVTSTHSQATAGSKALALDPCAIVTEAVATKTYGAGSTVTASPSTDKRTCQVSIEGLSYDLNVHVDPASDFKLQKSLVFENPTAFAHLGDEAFIGKSSDSSGAVLGLLYRTDDGAVYLSGESDLAKLTALANAIAAES